MFFTLKLKKAWLFPLFGVIIFLVLLSAPKPDIADRGASLLRSLGYEVSLPPVESLTVTLPLPEDPVFTEYNVLQKEAGLDLTPYAGKEAERITFSVKKEGKEFRANLLFRNKRLIGGDICTTNLHGEMYPLC